jgi:hypothetical protein
MTRVGFFFGGRRHERIGRVRMPGEVDPALRGVDEAVSATRLDARRESKACDRVADHLALTASEAADGISHEQDLRKVFPAQGGSAEALPGAELTLDGDAMVGV